MPVDEDDPRYNDYIDKMNKQNESGPDGPKDPDEEDPTDPHKPAPLAPPVDHTAPIGTVKNPIVVPSRRGAQY